MAEAPVPGGNALGGFFSGNKRIPQLSFWGYMFGGVVADVLLCDWCPGAGTAFVLFCRGMYFMNGYKTDKMMTTTVVNAVLGFVPIVADFTTIAFVVSSYAINVAETKAGATVTAVAGKKIAEMAAAKSVGDGLKGLGGGMRSGGGASVEPTGSPRSSSYGQPSIGNGITRDIGSAARRGSQKPETTAEKNIGYGLDDRERISRDEKGNPSMPSYKNTGNVDGVRPEPYVPRQPIFKTKGAPDAIHTPNSQNDISHRRQKYLEDIDRENQMRQAGERMGYTPERINEIMENDRNRRLGITKKAA